MLQINNSNSGLIKLLKLFYNNINLNDHELDAINHYLFKNGTLPFEINIQKYEDTIIYLKDLIDLNHFKSTEDIMRYYHILADSTANELRPVILPENNTSKKNYTLLRSDVKPIEIA